MKRSHVNQAEAGGFARASKRRRGQEWRSGRFHHDCAPRRKGRVRIAWEMKSLLLLRGHAEPRWTGRGESIAALGHGSSKKSPPKV